jgi:hypothetical protein
VLSPSVVLLAACRLPDPATWDDESDARIAVDRPEISFPTVDVGDDGPVVQRLTVKRRGHGSADRAVDGSHARDGLPRRSAHRRDARSRGHVHVRHQVRSRTAFEHEDVLVVESDDPERPMLTIPLRGVGLAPVLEVDPARLNFGTTDVGARSRVASSSGTAGTTC